MKKTSSILNIIVILIIIFSNSCKNKDPNSEFYRITIGEPKSYLYSLPGSYWIYKNTMTGALDTQICTSFTFDSVTIKGTEDYSRHITVEYDNIARFISSSYNQWVYYDNSGGHNPNSKYFNSGTTILDRSAKGPGTIVPFLYPFENGLLFATGSSISTCKGIDSALTIQGKTYFNVAKFDIDLDAIDEKDCPGIPVTTYYWAKDVGLIKKNVKNCNYSWELIEYNIIK